MRIYDDHNEQSLPSVMIFLTKKELRELRGYVDSLLEGPLCDHVHLTDDEYRREITLASYSETEKNTFAEQFNELVQNDDLDGKYMPQIFTWSRK